MKQFLKVCSSILLLLLCLISSHFLAAQSVIKNLFQEQTQHAGKKDFVENAIFFSLNQQILQEIYQSKQSEFKLNLPFENGKELQLTLKQAHYLGADFKVKVQKLSLIHI